MGTTQISDTLDKDYSTWKYLFTDLADPRVSDWFLMSNPVPVFLIVMSYLYFVIRCGPRYMKDKQPYELKKVIQIYNLVQIIWNMVLFEEAAVLWSSYNWNCQPIDRSNDPAALWVVFGCYVYFLNKITDLLDTIFFVLRKKDNQISFLHVFHHAMMPIATWVGVKYWPGGHGTFYGLLNTFVHVLIYGYYYLASLGPQMQKYLWWKRYLTRIQLIQFCLIFIHGCQLFVFDCDYPKWPFLITAPNAIFFYYLFTDFYRKSYSEVDKNKTNNTVSSDANNSVKTHEE